MTEDQPTPIATDEFLTTADPGSGSRPAGEAGAEAEALAIDLARLFADDKCSDIIVLDVEGISPITSYIVIASGTSERQMKSVLDHGVDLAEERGAGAFRVTRDSGAKWLVADFVDVVAHLFEPNTRAHYDLEMLWGDAKRVEWSRSQDAGS